MDDKNVKSNFKKLKNQVFKYEELTERYFLVTFGKDVTILFPVKKTDQNDVNNIFIICLSIPYLRFEKKKYKDVHTNKILCTWNFGWHRCLYTMQNNLIILRDT